MNAIIPRPIRDFIDRNNYTDFRRNLLPIVLRTTASALLVFAFLKTQSSTIVKTDLYVSMIVTAIVSLPLLFTSIGSASFYYSVINLVNAIALKSIFSAQMGLGLFALGYLAYEIHDKFSFGILEKYLFNRKKASPVAPYVDVINQIKNNSPDRKNNLSTASPIPTNQNTDLNLNSISIAHPSRQAVMKHIDEIKENDDLPISSILTDAFKVKIRKKNNKVEISQDKNAEEVDAGNEIVKRINTVQLAKQYYTNMIKQDEKYLSLAVGPKQAYYKEKIAFYKEELEKIGEYAKGMDWFTCKYFRKLISEKNSFAEAVKHYISAPINMRIQEIYLDKIKQANLLRVGIISDMRNGWVSFEELAAMCSDADKFIQKLTYLMEKARGLNGNKREAIEYAIQDILALPTSIEEMASELANDIAEEIKIYSKERKDVLFMLKKHEKQHEKTGMLYLQRYRLKQNHADKSNKQTKIIPQEDLDIHQEIVKELLPIIKKAIINERTHEIIKNPAILAKVVQKRKNTLLMPMMQLIQCQIYNNLDLIKACLINHEPFSMIHLSLLNPTKKEFDKTGWMHDEAIEISDMQSMFKFFQGMTLIFDGTGPRIDGEKIHLPMMFDEIKNKEVKLNTLFFNICVQGYSDFDHLKINQEAISFFEQHHLFQDNEQLQAYFKGTETHFLFAHELLVALLKCKKIARSIGCLSAKDRTAVAVHCALQYAFICENLRALGLVIDEDHLNPFGDPHDPDRSCIKICLENDPTFEGLKIDPRQNLRGVSRKKRWMGGLQTGMAHLGGHIRQLSNNLHKAEKKPQAHNRQMTQIEHPQ
jgi:hypothetical protein